MKDIFIENGERKFKLVPNIAVDSLGQETVTVGLEEEVLILPSFFEEFEPKGNIPVVYLGKSISLMAEADVVYFGGNKELGNIDSDFNTETTYGSFKLAIKTILTHKPTIKIILFTPTPRGKFENQPNYGEANSKGYKLIDYVNCVKEVGEFYNLKVLDLYHLSGFNQFTIDAFTTDKLHHNDLGTEQIVPLIVDCISNS